ncbi:hypothetical protein MHU86_18059 [Fragilaria crotonensis]|nr:hypothetical protein MHU86_18059 [Fragilaria crotonensis]
MLGKHDNIATFSLAPGYHNYECFCCEAGLTQETEAEGPVALPSGIISDDESASGYNDDEREGNVSDSEDADSQRPWKTTLEHLDMNSGNVARFHKANEVDFSLDGPTKTQDSTMGEPTSTTNIIVDEEDRQPSDLAELLMAHHQYGHVSMRKLQEMARQGILPKRLATCRCQRALRACIRKQRKDLGEGRLPNPARRERHPRHQDRSCRLTNWYHQRQD